VATKWNHGGVVVGFVFLIHVCAKRLAARQTRGPLGHGGAGTIEAAQRQNVDFTEEVSDRPRGELLP
jgi:hypothetical protein